jgi:hypothetical protein
MEPATMKLLLVGATGLVGSHVLRQALSDERVARVVAPTRRALPEHAKLQAPLVSFEHRPTTPPGGKPTRSFAPSVPP